MLISETIERYLDDAATGSSLTRRTYRTAMNRFQEYLMAKRTPPDSSELTQIRCQRLLGFATWLLDEAVIGQQSLHTYLSRSGRLGEFSTGARLAPLYPPGIGPLSGRRETGAPQPAPA